MQTTIKITNRQREDGGAFYISPEQWPNSPIAKSVRRILTECQEAEPRLDWHLETRGTSTDWHRFDV